MEDIKTVKLSKSAPGQTDAGASGMAWQAGCLVTIFEDDDGTFGYCYHGISGDGNSFESDDVTGFSTAREAEADARANYQPMPGD